MQTKRTYLIDFDSTFIQVETFDILADIALKDHPERKQRLEFIHDITQQAMEGKIGFEDSLKDRIGLLSLNQSYIEQTIAILKEKITPSFLRHRDFFEQNKDNIIILTGSFIDIVWPIVHSFGIKRENVFANRFLYDFDGNIHGYDRSNPLAQDQGKVKLVQQLNLEGEVVIIGDGYNDYEVKASNLASMFIALTENIARPPVVKLADAVIDSLEGLFFTFDLPYSTQVERKKVLLLENIHPDVVRYFQNSGYEVTTQATALENKALAQALVGVNVLGIRSKTQVDSKVLEACPDLEAIGAFCIGTNQIDLAQCSKQGIAVFNAPFSNTRSVVELALAEIIMLVRQAAKSNSQFHKGQWHKSSLHAHEVRGKTLGIIGYGNIGSQLSILAEAIGIHVIFYDIEDRLPLGNAKACHTLEQLLSQSDVVSIHVDGRPENKHLMGAAQFNAMKKGAVFLNLSRDSVVDFEALQSALVSEKLAGVGVDVFPNEPHESKAKFTTPLQQFENTILTPHIGGSTEEAQQNIGEYVSKNLHAYCNDGSTLGSVNFPTLSLPSLNYPQRIIHLHDNVPGILAQINALFAELKCNIEGQFLKTNDKMGYVITDLNHEISPEVVDRLENISHTIKVRSLAK